MGAAISWGNHLFNPALTVTASVAGSSQVSAVAFDTAYPAANAMDPDPSKEARVNYTRNAVAGGYVLASWAFATTSAGQQSARAIAAINCRIPSDATQVTVKAYDYTGAGVFEKVYLAADLVRVPGTTDRYTLPAVHTAAANIASVALLVFLPVSTSGWIGVGVMWAGEALALSGTADTWVQAPVDGSLVDRSDAGALLADVKAVRGGLRTALPRLTEAEAFGSAASPNAPSMVRLQFEAGRHDPVLVVQRDTSAFWLQRGTHYGALRQVPQLRCVGGGVQEFEAEIDLEAIT
jgi:hypothetical protein